jgi:ATP-dependent helicase/nuclease subunit B
MAKMPGVFTIPSGAPFLATLAQALLDGELIEGFSRAAGPLALASATLYVPTRRAARALAECFAAGLPGTSALLPRILPLGQLEALEPAQALTADAGDALDPDLPQAIGDIARRLILTRLILQWGASVRHAIVSVGPDGERKLDTSEALLVATSAADAWHLSSDLAGLVDELIIEGVDWRRFEPLGLGTFDDYWRITLDFLNIAMDAWPRILNDRGLVDRATRQMQLIAREIARFSQRAPTGPVIIAGSTGTNRATADLMAAVARSPMGAVVLPGLDLELDEPSWNMIEADQAAGHPQAALHRLLDRLGVLREDVRQLGFVPPKLAWRARTASEALRPADSTHLWQTRAQRLADAEIDLALADVALIEAADERIEALAAALVLREALETEGRTAALITPDRELARRVRAELRRWNIEAEDSGGEALAQTGIGTLARLVIQCVASQGGAHDVLALLTHPLARLGRAPATLGPLVQALEVGVFRGAIGQTGLAGLAALVAAAAASAQDRHAHPARRRIGLATWRQIEALLEDLTIALQPLAAIEGSAPFPAWLAAHRQALASLLRDDKGVVRAFGLDGVALADLFAELEEAAAASLSFGAGGYAAFFDQILRESAVRGPVRAHPRIKILGLLEARLMAPDVAVLGGLDETIWPPATQTDAFLNRPMRAELGLSPPERRIGQTAHDFAAAFGAQRVVLTRALKRGGAPTVASRFLQRLAALAGKAWSHCRDKGNHYVALARALDRPAAAVRIKRPEPRPPVALRPQQLSVTRIETLRRDPYSIYAERILRLVPLDPVDVKMEAREFGTSLHLVIDRFTRAFPGSLLPADARARLVVIAREVFGDLLGEPEFAAFQWPRIVRNIDFLVGWEEQRRAAIKEIVVEQNGSLPLTLASGAIFKLTATADRIEKGRDGRLTIVDFKTGQPPGKNEVAVGFAPQLTLEAAMAAAGAFPGIEAGASVAGALYVRLSTSGAGGAPHPLEWPDRTFGEVVEDHMEQLRVLLEEFAREETPYLPRPFPKFASRFAVYDHLARVKEWSVSGGESEDFE